MESAQGLMEGPPPGANFLLSLGSPEPGLQQLMTASHEAKELRVCPVDKGCLRARQRLVLKQV